MREIRTSGSMSGDGKRSVAAWPKLPRPSSTLPQRKCRSLSVTSAPGMSCGRAESAASLQPMTPSEPRGRRHCRGREFLFARRQPRRPSAARRAQHGIEADGRAPSRASRTSSLVPHRDGLRKTETPKSGLGDQGPDWRFWSPIRDTETRRYPRNAAVPRGLEGSRQVLRYRPGLAHDPLRMLHPDQWSW